MMLPLRAENGIVFGALFFVAKDSKFYFAITDRPCPECDHSKNECFYNKTNSRPG